MAVLPISVTPIPRLPDTLPTVLRQASHLLRISSHRTAEPYFSRAGTHRFDDPRPRPQDRYATCYFGESLAVAVAETLLHDLYPKKGAFYVERAMILSRYVIQFKGKDLALADLTGAALKRLGGHAGLSGSDSYKRTKNWSRAIYDHPDEVDGILYMSRHKNDEKAIVVFDRAAHKIKMRSATRLSEHADFGRVGSDFNIRASQP